MCLFHGAFPNFFSFGPLLPTPLPGKPANRTCHQDVQQMDLEILLFFFKMLAQCHLEISLFWGDFVKYFLQKDAISIESLPMHCIH